MKFSYLGSEFSVPSDFQSTLSSSSSSGSSNEDQTATSEPPNNEFRLFNPADIPPPLNISRISANNTDSSDLTDIALSPSEESSGQDHTAKSSALLAAESSIRQLLGEEDAKKQTATENSDAPVEASSDATSSEPAPVTTSWKRRERGGSITGGSWEGREEFEKGQRKDAEKAEESEKR